MRTFKCLTPACRRRRRAGRSSAAKVWRRRNRRPGPAWYSRRLPDTGARTETRREATSPGLYERAPKTAVTGPLDGARARIPGPHGSAAAAALPADPPATTRPSAHTQVALRDRARAHPASEITARL